MKQPFQGLTKFCSDLRGSLVHAEMRDICSWTKNIRMLQPVLPPINPFIPGVSVKCPCPSVTTKGRNARFQMSDDCCSWSLDIDIPDCEDNFRLFLDKAAPEGTLSMDSFTEGCAHSYYLHYNPPSCKDGTKVKSGASDNGAYVKVEKDKDDPCTYLLSVHNWPGGGGGNGGCGVWNVKGGGSLPAGVTFDASVTNYDCLKTFNIAIGGSPVPPANAKTEVSIDGQCFQLKCDMQVEGAFGDCKFSPSGLKSSDLACVNPFDAEYKKCKSGRATVMSDFSAELVSDTGKITLNAPGTLMTFKDGLLTGASQSGDRALFTGGLDLSC